MKHFSTPGLIFGFQVSALLAFKSFKRHISLDKHWSMLLNMTIIQNTYNNGLHIIKILKFLGFSLSVSCICCCTVFCGFTFIHIPNQKGGCSVYLKCKIIIMQSTHQSRSICNFHRFCYAVYYSKKYIISLSSTL